jgi:hypothetical protein
MQQQMMMHDPFMDATICDKLRLAKGGSDEP